MQAVLCKNRRKSQFRLFDLVGRGDFSISQTIGLGLFWFCQGSRCKSVLPNMNLSDFIEIWVKSSFEWISTLFVAYDGVQTHYCVSEALESHCESCRPL